MPRVGDASEMSTNRRINVASWSIFSLIDKGFLSTIKLACVFGNSGNEALLITAEDEVFAVGSNGAGCHGVGDMNATLTPRRLDTLCQKNVLTFAYGSGPHVLALSRTGDVYTWGHNGYCQLGNGSTNHGLSPVIIQGGLANKKVKAVACGSHHSLALTDDGDVYAWGQNNCGQIGSGTTTNQSTPKKVSCSSFGSKQVTAMVAMVACGQTSSMAVLENGDVYGWGYNGNGQLGLGNNVNQLSPCRVTALAGIVINKVACGYAHTLALSDEGQLFAWGANSYGQLGTGNKANCSSPARVADELGRIVDTTATHYSHVSAATSQLTSKCYMWGQCHGQSVVTPTETPFNNLHDVLAAFASPAVTPEPMVAEMLRGPSLLDSFRKAFDDPETSDIKFLVDNKDIHVHRAVLKIRCEYFRSMFQDHWEEANKDVVEITQFTYPVYRAFLKFLYTDEVDLLPEDAIGLLDLANSYCESRLKRRCEAVIMQGITVDNVAMLYATAMRFNAADLEDFCFRFSLNHMTAVTQTAAFSQLDESTLKDFIAKAAVSGAFKS